MHRDVSDNGRVGVDGDPGSRRVRLAQPAVRVGGPVQRVPVDPVNLGQRRDATVQVGGAPPTDSGSVHRSSNGPA
jgi:hypothetical protein